MIRENSYLTASCEACFRSFKCPGNDKSQYMELMRKDGWACIDASGEALCFDCLTKIGRAMAAGLITEGYHPDLK